MNQRGRNQEWFYWIAIRTDREKIMLLYTVNRIMTVAMYIGILSLLIVSIGLYLYYSGVYTDSTSNIFNIGKSLFLLSLIFLIVGWIYKVKKGKANKG